MRAGSFQVHLVEARGAAENELDPAACQNVERGRVAGIIDEDADGVAAVRQWSRGGVESRVDVPDLVAKAAVYRVELRLLEVLGVEEGDAHGRPRQWWGQAVLARHTTAARMTR